MIYLSYLGESKNINYKDGDKKYLIVRRPVGNIPRGFIHLPQLSPSIELFIDAQRWKKNDFTDLEKKKLKELQTSTIEDSWWLLYEPTFMLELEKRKEIEEAISIIQHDIKNKLDVYLFCYCKNLCRCHRFLVGRYLESLGFDVDFRSSGTYQNNKTHTGSQLSFLND